MCVSSLSKLGFVLPLQWQGGSWQSSPATVLLPLSSEQRLRCSSSVAVHIAPTCSAWSCSDTLSRQVRKSLQSFRFYFFFLLDGPSLPKVLIFLPLPSFHASSDSFCSAVAFFPFALLSVILPLLLQVAFPEPFYVPFLFLQLSLTSLLPSVVTCGSPELLCSLLLCWHSTSVRP